MRLMARQQQTQFKVDHMKAIQAGIKAIIVT